MPIQKDLKRLVRARMRKTGESYTAARARLLEKKGDRKPTTNEAPPSPQGDLAALAGIRDEAVARKTGRTWKEWLIELDRAGAASLSHREIARLVHERFEISGWWSQTVTVGYERIRGLREKGQRRDGSFEVTKSRTYPVPVANLWQVFCRCEEWLGGEKLRTTKAIRHRSMRMKWFDGTPVEATFFAKGAAKSQLSLQHRNIGSRGEAARLKTYWSERLEAIGDLLERRH